MLGLVLATGTIEPSAYAASEKEIRAQIDEALTHRHPKDSAVWWRGLGENAPTVIISMYEDTTRIFYKLRLIEGLAYFTNSDEAIQFLKREAERTNDEVIRGSAISSIAKAGGEDQLEFLKPFLESKNPQTRFAAARAIQSFTGNESKEVVRRYRAQEKASWIVERLDGEYKKPTQTLTPVSSNSDPSRSPLLGTWEGVWIAPVPIIERQPEKPLAPFFINEVRLRVVVRSGRLAAELEFIRPAAQLPEKRRTELLALRIPLKTLELLENKVYATYSTHPFSVGGDATGGAWESRGDLIPDAAFGQELELKSLKGGSRWVLKRVSH